MDSFWYLPSWDEWIEMRDIEDLACASKSRHYHVDTYIYGQEYAHLVAKKRSKL